MKYFAFLMFFLLAIGLFAQQQESATAPATDGEKLLVDVKDLPPELLAKVKTKQKLETYGEYAKWGHEVGVAVNETLTAVTDQTAKFAKTDVGRLAMFLVAWKIMAKDVLALGNLSMHYIVGIPLLVVGLFVVLWSYRKLCVPRRIVVEKGPGLSLWASKKYEMHYPDKSSYMKQDDWVAVHCIAAILIAIVGLGTIFSG